LHGDAPDAVGPGAFALMDRGFQYLNQDFPLIHLNRRKEFTQYFDPTEAPRRCTSRQLEIFPALVLGQELGSAPAQGAVVTPQQQWAYASVQALNDGSQSGRSAARLLDVRANLTVSQGCVGVGVLTPDQSAFVNETAITAGQRARVADLLFEAGGRPHWFVVRNCSPDGASAGETALCAAHFRISLATTSRGQSSMPR